LKESGKKMNVVLGIDGGGTRTRASIVAGDQVLAHVESGSIKRLRVGAEALKPTSARCSRMSTRRPVSPRGAPLLRRGQRQHARHKEWITAVFKDFGAERSEVVGDEVIALDAAFQGGPGILQIAGTGSNTIGRAPDGSRECAGGYSSRLGDEGSGYWIGLHSVRRALKRL
jgi:glucosamine kinase